MAQTSFPFENVDVSETQFSQWARNFQESGVNGVPGDAKLLVSGDDSGLQVRVASGQAFVRGHYYINTAQETIAIDTAGEDTRIDSIVLELDVTINSITLKAIKGVPVTANPVPPTLIQSDAGIYQLLLANVTIANAATSIVSGDVVDKRTFMSNRIGVWTTATRPTVAVANNTIGYNATTGYHEIWNGLTWEIFGQKVWTSLTRPVSPMIGLTGYNTTILSHEVWNGTVWTAVGGSDMSPFLLMGA